MQQQDIKPRGIIVFEAAEQELCFDINLLNEILQPADVAVDQPADQVSKAGLDFQGHRYLLVDLISLFGKRRQHGDRRRRILLAEYNGRRVALDVDAVTQIISVVGDQGSLLTFVPTTDAPNCLGYYDTEAGKLWRIDFESITSRYPDFVQ